MTPQQAQIWRRAALTAWIVLAVAASVKTIIEPEQHTVYTAFSHAARDWWAGHSLYQDRAYYYSPTFAVLMTPLAIFPDWLGGVFWTWLSIGALVVSLRVFWRDVIGEVAEDARSADILARSVSEEDNTLTRDHSASLTLRAGVQSDSPQRLTTQDSRLRTHASRLTPHASRLKRLAANLEGPFHLLVLIGTVRSVWSGQSNALLMALVLLGAAAIVRRKWWRAAGLLATPIYIKVWPVVVAGLFAVQWPRRLMPRLAIATVALAALPLCTKPAADVAESYRDWWHCLSSRQTDDFRFTGYRDAWTIWEQIHKPVNKRAYQALQLAGAAAVLGWTLWRRRRIMCDRRMAIYTIAAWTVWQLVLGPGTERLTYNIIAPPLAWAVLTAIQEQRGRTLAIAAYLTTYLLGVGGVERFLVRFVPAATALEPVGVLIFAAWLMWHAGRKESCSTMGATSDLGHSLAA